MSTTRSFVTSALVVLLAIGLQQPAWAAAQADGAEQRRDDARQERAEVAAELDTLSASNEELEGAVRALDAGVAVQANETQSAERALQSAESGLSSAERELVETEQRLTQLRAEVAAAAVWAYVHPGGNTLMEIVKSRDIGEASRRQVLLSALVSRDQDALEQLRATRQDHQIDKANLATARELAEERRQSAAAKLAELQAALSDQSRLKSALDTRIEEYTAEVEALSREEEMLSELIVARQAEADAGGTVAASSGSGLAWPALGPVTSGFGYRWGRLHSGIDIGAGYGDTVRSARGGIVILAGYNGGYGNTVVVDHGGGFSTLYAHMSYIAVSEGSTVGRAEFVGRVGSTGNSTGAHLHYETREGGVARNPMGYGYG